MNTTENSTSPISLTTLKVSFWIAPPSGTFLPHLFQDISVPLPLDVLSSLEHFNIKIKLKGFNALSTIQFTPYFHSDTTNPLIFSKMKSFHTTFPLDTLFSIISQQFSTENTSSSNPKSLYSSIQEISEILAMHPNLVFQSLEYLSTGNSFENPKFIQFNQHRLVSLFFPNLISLDISNHILSTLDPLSSIRTLRSLKSNVHSLINTLVGNHSSDIPISEMFNQLHFLSLYYHLDMSGTNTNPPLPVECLTNHNLSPFYHACSIPSICSIFSPLILTLFSTMFPQFVPGLSFYQTFEGHTYLHFHSNKPSALKSATLRVGPPQDFYHSIFNHSLSFSSDEDVPIHVPLMMTSSTITSLNPVLDSYSIPDAFYGSGIDSLVTHRPFDFSQVGVWYFHNIHHLESFHLHFSKYSQILFFTNLPAAPPITHYQWPQIKSISLGNITQSHIDDRLAAVNQLFPNIQILKIQYYPYSNDTTSTDNSDSSNGQCFNVQRLAIELNKRVHFSTGNRINNLSISHPGQTNGQTTTETQQQKPTLQLPKKDSPFFIEPIISEMFPELKVAIITDKKSLKKIFDINSNSIKDLFISSHASSVCESFGKKMPFLEKLFFQDCPNLYVFFSNSNKLFFPNLQELYLRNSFINSMTSLTNCDNTFKKLKKLDLKNSKIERLENVFLPQLEYLDASNTPLVSIDHKFGTNTPMLNTLLLDYSPNLKFLPDLNIPSLVELHVSHCPNLIQIMDPFGQFLPLIKIFNLSGNTSLTYLPNFTLPSISDLDLALTQPISMHPQFGNSFPDTIKIRASIEFQSLYNKIGNRAKFETST